MAEVHSARRAVRGALVLACSLAVFSAWAMRPPEVGPTLRFDPDRATLRWDGIAGAAAYDVYRGARGDASDLACLIFRTPDLSAVDPETPGLLLSYLVAAWNADGEGPLGDASDGTPRAPAVRCADDDGDLVRDDRDNCPGAANPSQADQNDDGLGDACDPKTYTFDGDLPGQRPADMTQRGAVNATFAVRDVAGDLAVSYDGSGQGCVDAFDRLPQDGLQQAQAVYLDTTALADQFEINLWNEGSYAENAGGGVLFRVDATGTAYAWVRRGREFTALGQASLGAPGRLRLRLAKDFATRSTLRLDRWNGAGWDPNVGVFMIADDHRLFGRGLGLSDLVEGRRPLLRLTAEKEIPAAALALFRAHDGLADWKLFQRGPDGHAPLPVPVSYRAQGAARLDVRIVESANGAPLPGFDWADHAFPLSAAPAGATASFALDAVPAGGNYDLEARLVDAATEQVLGTDAVAEIAVGDVFLAIGQSNMSGYSGSLEPAEPPVDRVHLFGNDYAWKRAREPMDDGTDQVDRVSEEAPLHTLTLRFAKEIEKAVGVPVAIIPAPLGGTNLYSQWQRNAADPFNRGTLYGSAVWRVLTQSYAHPIRGALWYQGESDAGRGTELYLADLRALVSNLRADLGSPSLFFGNCQLATYLTEDFETWLPIQEAQRRQGLDPQAGVVPLIDQPRSDSIHLSVDGYKTAGVRLARVVRAGSYGQPAVQVPKLVSARFTSGARTQIEITWDKNVTGGVPGLFRAYNGTTPVQPVSQSASGAAITLLFANSLPSNATISYGYSRNPVATWVVGADGSGPVLAFYKVAVGAP
jgi:hypothetical protein